MLTLQQATDTGCLSDFIAQAEAEGVGPTWGEVFDALLGRITAPQPDTFSHYRGPNAIDSTLQQTAQAPDI